MSMPTEPIQKKIPPTKPRGKRPMGRPRTKWQDQIREDLEDREQT